jgi:uncharacterized membrane protein
MNHIKNNSLGYVFPSVLGFLLGLVGIQIYGALFLLSIVFGPSWYFTAAIYDALGPGYSENFLQYTYITNGYYYDLIMLLVGLVMFIWTIHKENEVYELAEDITFKAKDKVIDKVPD